MTLQETTQPLFYSFKNLKRNYDNLDTNVLTDNKIFWKTVKPFLSEKVIKNCKLNVTESEKIVSSDDKTAETFSEYVINTPKLNMPSHGYKCPNSLKPDHILKIINKYKDHPIIILIKLKTTLEFITSQN